jgi:hypothetical protein
LELAVPAAQVNRILEIMVNLHILVPSLLLAEAEVEAVVLTIVAIFKITQEKMEEVEVVPV